MGDKDSHRNGAANRPEAISGVSPFEPPRGNFAGIAGRRSTGSISGWQRINNRRFLNWVEGGKTTLLYKGSGIGAVRY